MVSGSEARSFGRKWRIAGLGLAVMLGASLPGCQVWNAWLDMLKWRDLSSKQKPATAESTLSANQPTSPGGPARVAMIPRVTVFRISLPVGAFSTNDKIWPQLNEDAVESKTAVLMAQNGLRAATGAAAKWPSIAKLLDVPGASTEQYVYQTDGRSSVAVVTRPGVSDQIVVSVDRDLQQQGRTFDRCDNGFRLAMAPARSRPELLVQLEPVCSVGGGGTGTGGGGGFVSEESFPDLRMSVTLNADQFLVVAPMDPKANPFSVGTQWLSNKESVPASETVLIFVPAPSSPPTQGPAAAK